MTQSLVTPPSIWSLMKILSPYGHQRGPNSNDYELYIVLWIFMYLNRRYSSFDINSIFASYFTYEQKYEISSKRLKTLHGTKKWCNSRLQYKTVYFIISKTSILKFSSVAQHSRFYNCMKSFSPVVYPTSYLIHHFHCVHILETLVPQTVLVDINVEDNSWKNLYWIKSSSIELYIEKESSFKPTQ